ncbi:hypothetical protein F5148DRAFT_1150648 [Russula earlei]|uniref:Uncharacterized protein n=1 Tax=Russula earlei TaxID=71964 RepID=A0ACC0U5M8_9AGAM|nr:hypothetical protein F5148DRAFT_1150648 [Russula earlei]
MVKGLRRERVACAEAWRAHVVGGEDWAMQCEEGGKVWEEAECHASRAVRMWFRGQRYGSPYTSWGLEILTVPSQTFLRGGRRSKTRWGGACSRSGGIGGERDFVDRDCVVDVGGGFSYGGGVAVAAAPSAVVMLGAVAVAAAAAAEASTGMCRRTARDGGGFCFSEAAACSSLSDSSWRSSICSSLTSFTRRGGETAVSGYEMVAWSGSRSVGGKRETGAAAGETDETEAAAETETAGAEGMAETRGAVAAADDAGDTANWVELTSAGEAKTDAKSAAGMTEATVAADEATDETEGAGADETKAGVADEAARAEVAGGAKTSVGEAEMVVVHGAETVATAGDTEGAGAGWAETGKVAIGDVAAEATAAGADEVATMANAGDAGTAEAGGAKAMTVGESKMAVVNEVTGTADEVETAGTMGAGERKAMTGDAGTETGDVEAAAGNAGDTTVGETEVESMTTAGNGEMAVEAGDVGTVVAAEDEAGATAVGFGYEVASGVSPGKPEITLPFLDEEVMRSSSSRWRNRSWVGVLTDALRDESGWWDEGSATAEDLGTVGGEPGVDGVLQSASVTAVGDGLPIWKVEAGVADDDAAGAAVLLGNRAPSDTVAGLGAEGAAVEPRRSAEIAAGGTGYQGSVWAMKQLARVEGLAPKPGCPRQPKRGGGEDGGLRSTQIQPHWGSQLKRAKPGRAEFVGLDGDPKTVVLTQEQEECKEEEGRREGEERRGDRHERESRLVETVEAMVKGLRRERVACAEAWRAHVVGGEDWAMQCEEGGKVWEEAECHASRAVRMWFRGQRYGSPYNF